MIDAYIILGLAGLIWVVFLLLRAPSIVLFMSILSGQILATQAHFQVYNWLNPFIKITDERYLQLALFVLPVILTLIIMRRKIAKSKITIELIPYALVAILGVLLAGDYSWLLQTKLHSAQEAIGNYRSLVIVVATISTLVSAWINYPSANKKKKS